VIGKTKVLAVRELRPKEIHRGEKAWNRGINFPGRRRGTTRRNNQQQISWPPGKEKSEVFQWSRKKG